MLRRIGFGTTGTVIDAELSVGDVATTVASILDTPFEKDPGALATPIPEFDWFPAPENPSEAEMKKRTQKRRQQTAELTDWWLRRMTAVGQPALEKLTFVWHNHFATSIAAVRTAKLMADQNATIRTRCLGDFRELSYAMLTDAAMLRWLNGDENTKKSPNENLSREFMELFALGHGNGYSEMDVREGARALTGWTLDENFAIRFEPNRHDAKPKTMLGVTGALDASAFCDIVLQQPNSPGFVASRLWQRLASDAAPTPETLTRLVEAYGPRRDLKALTRAILTDPGLLDEPGTLINGPVDWYVGLLRTLDVSLDDSEMSGYAARTLRSLGQLPFLPPNVSGWPRGQVWLSTATAGFRIGAATKAAEKGDISSITDVPANERIDAVGYLLGIGAWSDRTVKTLTKYRRDPPAIVVAAANTPEYLTT
ncbi:DUF1800 domain-containing protein [Mycolicibacterium mengxianglii]|uniref:DUF1800 domain-containing protein n=1 Tax=Mycolicibacterium mengxianglii TaxID=2736649 RepID=UPI001E51F48E|nr:DUF1800 domain-containing protein [Mycolicibacterium mengxianglii]